MKSLFDQTTREELTDRINSLTENSQPQWGKMTVSQMLKHCAQWDEMALGKKQYRQMFIGKLFGRRTLKGMMNEEPMKRNLPTVPSFKISDNPDFAEQQKKCLSLVDEYAHCSNAGFLHPFFGKLSKEHTGYMAYKHLDHHLRQFNV